MGALRTTDLGQSSHLVLSQITFFETRDFHGSFQEAELQGTISVNRQDDPFSPSRHNENVMAALDPSQSPATVLKHPREILPRNLLHRANSIT